MLQYRYSYLRPRTDLPGQLSPDGDHGAIGADLLSYLRAEPQLTMVAYSPGLKGGYARRDKPLDPAFGHAVTPARLAALREVAEDAGATVDWPAHIQRLRVRRCSMTAPLRITTPPTSAEQPPTHRETPSEADGS